MGTNIPNGRRQRLEWIEGLIGQWNTNFASIGLTSAQVIDLAQDVVNARASFVATEQIRDNARAQTLDYYSQADATHAKASQYVKVIKGFADSAADPSAVYLSAGLTPNDPPSPQPAPDQPAINNAVLGGDGSVTIEFSATGPAGTAWQVSRKLATETTFASIGFADPATKSFVDSTVPPGTSTATYQMRGVRGGQVGPASFDFTVKLGVTGQEEALGIAA